jgi:hypothetical protein
MLTYENPHLEKGEFRANSGRITGLPVQQTKTIFKIILQQHFKSILNFFIFLIIVQFKFNRGESIELT